MSELQNDSDLSPAQVPMTPLKGLLVLLGVMVVVAGFIVLNTVLGIHEYWAGFLSLMYWTGIEHMQFEKLPACIVGALLGLLMGWLLLMLPTWFGEQTGGLIFLGLVLPLVYCMVMGWVPVAVNLMTMLFLTVGTIPAVQSEVNFTHALIALLLAIAYFVGLVWSATLLKQVKSRPSAA